MLSPKSHAEPQNVQKLRSFLGVVNYYAKFIHHLSTITQPLNHLLPERIMEVDERVPAGFSKSETTASVFKSSSSLRPRPLTEAGCDTSAYGVGAVLSHVFMDGIKRPIAYASRILTQSERERSTLLSLMFGIRKFISFYMAGGSP